jgi:uncharacterized protein (DUF433 family)
MATKHAPANPALKPLRLLLRRNEYGAASHPRLIASRRSGAGVRRRLSHARRTRLGMTFTDRIEMNPRVMLGKPVIRGTRIPVELILRKLREGASEADLLDAYRNLAREDIQAAMRYAADTIAHEEVVFIGKDSSDRRE